MKKVIGAVRNGGNAAATVIFGHNFLLFYFRFLFFTGLFDWIFSNSTAFLNIIYNSFVKKPPGFVTSTAMNSLPLPMLVCTYVFMYTLCTCIFFMRWHLHCRRFAAIWSFRHWRSRFYAFTTLKYSYIHMYCSHVHICAYKQVWLVSCTVQKCMYMCICALVVVDFYRSILIDCFYEAFAGKSGELIYCALPLSAATTNIFCTDAIVDDYTIHTYTHTHTNIQRH